MKTVIQIVVVALLFGGGSAAGTHFWRKQQTALKQAEERAEAAEKAQAASQPFAGLAEPGAESNVPKFEPEEKLTLPVAVRPTFVEGSDEASRLIVSLNQRLAATYDKEQKLHERQEALKLIFADIRNEQTEVNKLRRQVSDEFEQVSQSAQNAMKAAQEERDLLRQELEELQKTAPNATAPTLTKPSTADPPDDPAAVKRMGAIYDSMPADVVAEVLQQFAKNGREESVVQLLQAMKDRQAAKVLTAIATTDAATAASLTERLKRTKAAAKP